MTHVRIRPRPSALRATLVLAGAALLAAACGPGATVAPTPGPTATPAGSAAAGTCPTAGPEPMAAGETRLVSITTELGVIEVSIEADLGPLAAANFVALAACGFYDGVVFHRAIPGFMIQGGDPTGTGGGGPGYQFANDPANVGYDRGVIAMANSGLNTNGSQFFIVMEEYLPPSGTRDYSIFGRVTSGMEVVDAIAAAADGEYPSDPVIIESIAVSSL
jgi:cyclophilin family peptidyl-prolyl cis-trans isomerase